MKKRVDGNGIAMLIDLDDCLGCFGCEAACRETHRYPYDEDWMKLIRREPWLVDGKLRQYHVPAPVRPLRRHREGIRRTSLRHLSRIVTQPDNYGLNDAGRTRSTKPSARPRLE